MSREASDCDTLCSLFVCFDLFSRCAEAEQEAPPLFCFCGDALNSIKPIAVIKPYLPDNGQVKSEAKSSRFFKV